MISVADKMLLVFGMCFLVEQIFYRILGSYPYHHGFTVYTNVISNYDVTYWESIKSKAGKMDIKVDSDKGEVYLKYRYPSLVIGPSLFIGQIKANGTRGLLQIKIGPISAIFVLFLLIYPFASSGVIVGLFYQLIDAVIMVCIVGYFYFRLLKIINAAMLESKPRV